MDVLAILKQLGIGVFLEWGQEREWLEDRIGRTRTKYSLVLVIIIAADIAVFVIGFWHLPPWPLNYAALVLAVGATAIAAWLSIRYQEHFGKLRRISDDFLNGKIPVAVASWTLGTLPGKIIVLLRFGGAEGQLIYWITTKDDLSGAMGSLLITPDDYVLVSHREPSYMETAQALDNPLHMEVLGWLARRVGGKVLFLPLKFYEQLEQLERGEATRAAVALG